ncbi:MAG: DNA-deoxyinosine glycosylase [Bacteroidales bacterium]|nr:DNA-deoxyinosine glycosylase [Bacteroidales bacterium]
MPKQIVSFPPIIATHPKILILGTMPSVISLQESQYYAHPRNVFWKILSTINDMDCPTDYQIKKQLIINMNLALWDVCHTCIRPGSADSNIREEEPNHIEDLLTAHPTIHSIIFNGKTAEKLFHRHLRIMDGINLITLPSTSPAYTLPFEKKMETWQMVLQNLKNS